MDTLKTYLKLWQPAPAGATCKPELLAIESKLIELGYNPLRISSDSSVNELAIEMPNGHPLFINDRTAWADRHKGYLHFHITMPENANWKFISKAAENSALVAPKNCTLKTLTAKKLGAIIEYNNSVLSSALLEFYAGRKLVAEWRERVKNSDFSVYESSVKSNNADNLNIEVASPCKNFRITLGAQSEYKYVSQSLAFIGSGSWDQFLKLCAMGEPKSWHLVDFTGLNFVHCGFLIFGSSRAVNSWCVENEKLIGGIGFIVRSFGEGAGYILDCVNGRKVVAL